MKLTVLGATGPTGQIFTAMALDAGHDVTVLVRNPAKLQSIRVGSKKLNVVTGDATDAKAVSSVVDGAEVVVSCLGSHPGGPCPMLSIAFRHILAAAARQARPPRCVLMTTIGVGGTSFHVKCLLGAFVAGWKVIHDYEKADALVRAEHGDVPYVLVRPAHLTDGAGTDKYKLSLSSKGCYHFAMTISRTDVAKFLLRAACSPDFDNKAVQLF
ncbi:hypothetical protein AB1Y20_020956 [Prymnesium parvum]|uniref:NAD(P)-binding domain-containing protein n=1 Tax=Prymnesium parvum TaxID=97485 RepID=A0AB34JKQ0_PRYPA